MNIALFSDTYPPEINGVATSTYSLHQTLVEHGDKCVVVTTNPYNNKVTFEDDVLRLPGLYLKWLYGYRAAPIYNSSAMKILERFKPDVVHCQTDAPVGIFGTFVANRMHAPLVYTYHTMIEDYAYYFTRGHFDRAARHIIRFYFKGKSVRFNEFIAPSDKTKDYLRSVGIDSTVSVIPTGIDFRRLDPAYKDEADVAALKEKYGIKPEEFVVLSLGRIAKEKSIDVLLRGYASFLKRSTVPTKFVIVGLGPAVEELKSLSAHLGIEDHVVFTGPCKPSETQRFYHLGDCFASASITETQGLTFMEAMAAHLPVLARFDDNLVGTIQDGKTGFYFLDEEGFATKLENLISMSQEEKDKIIDSALEAIEPYSLERFYQNEMEVYRRVWKENW